MLLLPSDAKYLSAAVVTVMVTAAFQKAKTGAMGEEAAGWGMPKRRKIAEEVEYVVPPSLET